MADTTSMTPAAAAGKVLGSAHGDFLREAPPAVLRDIYGEQGQRTCERRSS